MFVYLKATNPPPPMTESLETDVVQRWGGTAVDYVSLQWFAICSSVMFFGAIGSTVSFFSRHHAGHLPQKENRSIVGAQLLGAVFALVLMFTFIGGLVQGSLFPRIQADSWTTLAIRVPDWCKLLVWAFIAGFSERFVPDLLDNLMLRGRSNEHEKQSRPEGVRPLQ